MKKILCSDIDGTLVDHQGNLLHLRDKEMLLEIQNQGHLVVLNTGRNIQEAMFLVDTLQLPYDYLVMNNGGHIIDKNKNEVLKKVIDKQIGMELIEYCIKQNVHVYFYAGSRTIGFVNNKTFEHTIEGNVEVFDIDFMEEYKKASSYDIIGLNQDDGNIDILEKIQSYILKHYQNDVTPIINTIYLDICPANITKGTGLNIIKEKEKAIAYSIGDSYNDISMFEASNYSYSFLRANQDVQDKADKSVNYVYEVCIDVLQ